jgi:hypothetical protein
LCTLRFASRHAICDGPIVLAILLAIIVLPGHLMRGQTSYCGTGDGSGCDVTGIDVHALAITLHGLLARVTFAQLHHRLLVLRLHISR